MRAHAISGNTASEWSMRVVTILLVIGFPVTLLISWLFDLTRKGFVRTEEVQKDAQPKGGSGLAIFRKIEHVYQMLASKQVFN